MRPHPIENTYFKYLCTAALLLGIQLLTFYIRIQGVEHIPEGQFTETDSYLYHWQANIIAENGKLPARDMDRWLPLGRDNTQLLSLYPYVLAYTHKLLPWLPLYDIQLYAPAICFTLGLGVLFLFLSRCYSLIFAAIVGLILATLPGSIERSAAGFGDRDAWCWMFGVLAVTSYLWKEEMAPGWRRYLATALAGFIVFLGSLSWEAFGLFLLIILSVELYKFCTTDTEQHLKEYLLYILMFVPWLYLISPAYRSGYGFSTHLFALTLAPPLVVFVLRGSRYLLLKHIYLLHTHGRKLAGGLTLLGIAIGLGYFFIQIDSLVTTTFTFHENRLMKSVTELADPTFQYWIGRYGLVLATGSVGLIIGSLELGKPKVISLRTALFLFFLTTFGRDLFNDWIGINNCNLLFFASIILAAFAISIIWFQRDTQENTPQKTVMLIAIVWFLLWGSLSRGALRHDFFTGVPLAFGTAWFLCYYIPHHIQDLKSLKILNTNIRERFAAVCITITVLGALLFLPGVLGYAKRSIHAATYMRKPRPGRGSIAETFQWIKTSLPPNTVIAAHWGYGGQLNVLGNINTVIDHDHYIHHWIHLYYRHVFCAQSEREALEFLKTHKATHLMLTEWGLTTYADQYSYIGSNEKDDRHFQLYKLVRENTPIGTAYQMKMQKTGTPLTFIDINRSDPETLIITANFRDKTTIKVPVNISTTQTSADIGNGGLILFFDPEKRLNNAYYVPPIGWDSLAVKIFLRREHSTAFVPIYPINGEATAKVKIWEIHYPSNINTNDKYLATEPEQHATENEHLNDHKH
ncbi:hypothetical protein J5I95_19475 [Candidatus Poribacteria bacterium]|nr:hypothetical protein [Candidatus Poribacteria bacterium]